MNEIREHVESWKKQLSERRSEFGGLPVCPCAKAANLACVSVPDAMELNGLLLMLGQIPVNSILVLRIEDREGVAEVLAAHRGMLADRNMLALASDPQHPTEVAGVRTTQNRWLLVLVQNKSELERVSWHLASSGYYDGWSAEQKAWLKDRK